MHPAAQIALTAATHRGRRRLLLLLVAAGAGGMVLLLLMISLMPGTSAASDNMDGVACPTDGVAVGGGDGELGLSPEQVANAQVIVGVGQKMSVPARGQVVAIATAIQESQLKNINHGDRDSLGLFQQRPSQGWGTAKQITNPQYSAQKFYSRLLKVPNWQRMPVTDAAQAVQRSGFPLAYAKHERRSVQIVASVGGSGAQQVDASGCTPQQDAPNSLTRAAVSRMTDQVGKPYVWGATGPDSFDCSGLIVYGWRQAGKQLNVRTSQQMHDVSTPVKSGEERPGDLIFTQFESGGPAHVLIVVKRGVAVEAPRTGLNVRMRAYDLKAEAGRLGRLPQSAMKTTT